MEPGNNDPMIFGFGFDEAGQEQLVETVLDTVLAGLRA